MVLHYVETSKTVKTLSQNLFFRARVPMVPQPTERDKSRIRTEARGLHNDVHLIPLHSRMEFLIVTDRIKKPG